MNGPRILFGRVFHCRRRPARHAFAYPVFFLRVPLAGLADAGRGIFSVDRWNLLSLMTRDHGPRDGTPLEPWVRAQLAQAGVRGADGEILLQAFPRVLGYVFNPIAIFHCHDRAGAAAGASRNRPSHHGAPARGAPRSSRRSPARARGTCRRR